MVDQGDKLLIEGSHIHGGDQMVARDKVLVGSLLAAVVAVGAAPALAGVSRTYGLFYQVNNLQTTATSADPYFWSASLRWFGVAGDLTAGTVLTPEPASTLYDMNEVAPGAFLYETGSNSEAEMLSGLPTGVYTFNVSGGSLGTDTGIATMPDPIHWPSDVPLFDEATFASFTTVDAAAPLTLGFNTFTTSAPIGFTFLVISQDSNFAQPVAQNVSTSETSFEVPAGTLLPNTHYTIVLYFITLTYTPSASFGGSQSYSGANYVTQAALFTGAPSVACALADVASDSLDTTRNPNGSIGAEDLDAFIAGFIAEDAAISDVASDSLDTTYNPNGTVGAEDLDAFIASFIAGC